MRLAGQRARSAATCGVHNTTATNCAPTTLRQGCGQISLKREYAAPPLSGWSAYPSPETGMGDHLKGPPLRVQISEPLPLTRMGKG